MSPTTQGVGMSEHSRDIIYMSNHNLCTHVHVLVREPNLRTEIGRALQLGSNFYLNLRGAIPSILTSLDNPASA